MNERVENGFMALFVASCMLLGGATRLAPIPLLIAELIAIVVLVALFIRNRYVPVPAGQRWPNRIVAALAIILVAYLMPLPPAIWSSLPGRAVEARTFQLLNMPLPWLPIALLPGAAMITAIAVLPAIAAYQATASGSARLAWAGAATVVAVAVLSAIYALIEAIAGSHHGFRLYGDATAHDGGIFANSNHNETLMLSGLVLLAGLTVRIGNWFGESPSRVAGYGGIALIGVLLVFAIVLNGSLAGLALLLPTLIACAVIVRNGQPGAMPVLIGMGGLLIAIFALVIALSSPVVEGFARTGRSVVGIDRVAFNKNTVKAAIDHLPLGSGPGSFEIIYPRYEDPNQVTNVFINHAHNDYVELFLETGLVGVALFAAFLIWWVARVRAVWSATSGRAALARAASIVTALIMIHSLVDYPMRTVTMMVVFAVCCGILSLPPVVGAALPAEANRRRSSSRHRRKTRHVTA